MAVRVAFLHPVTASRRSDLGAAARSVLEQRFPGEKLNLTDEKIGEILTKSAYRGGAKDVHDQADAVMSTIERILEKGYLSDAEDVQEAFGFMTHQVRQRGRDAMKKRQTWKKRIDPDLETSDSDAGDDSAIPSDEPGMPDLADQASVKSFLEVIDEHVPDLMDSLPPDEASLFKVIFEEGIGAFTSGIDENMNQSTALKELDPELYERNKKRWSGFVGDLRKRLLQSIWKYLDEEMSNKDYLRIKDEFFSDADPDAVRKQERKKEQGKVDEKLGRDLLKYRELSRKQYGEGLSPAEEKAFAALEEKLRGWEGARGISWS